MATTFHALWTSLDGQRKSALSACLSTSKSYLSQVAHGRAPSLVLARSLALCTLDSEAQLVQQVDRKVRELFPELQLPCGSRPPHRPAQKM